MRAHSLSIQYKLLEPLSRIHVDEQIRFERTVRGRNIFFIMRRKGSFLANMRMRYNSLKFLRKKKAVMIIKNC